MATQPKVKKLPIPSSGQLLASVVRALELDVPNDLAGRYFRGESVSPETGGRIHRLIAEAIVPALGLDAHSELVVEVLRATFHVSSERWDDAIGLLGSIMPTPIDWRSVAPAFAVFAAIELALRVGAASHVAESKPFHDDADRAAVFEEKRGLFLRKLVQDGKFRSREALADAVGASEAKTIDDWLDGRHRPNDSNLERLAAALSKPLGRTAEAVRASLRRYFAIWEIRNRMVEALGERHGRGILRQFAAYAAGVYGFLSMSELRGGRRLGSQLSVTTQGSDFESTKFILNHLRRREEAPVWKAALRACMGDWFGFLRWATTAAMQLELSGQCASEEMSDAVLFCLCDPLEPPHPEMTLEEWRKMGERDPRIACARLEQQGEQSLALAMYQDAARSFRAALSLDPQSPALHYRLGCALWRPAWEDKSEVTTADHERDVKEAEGELWLAYSLADECPAIDRQLPLVELGWLLLDTKRGTEMLALAESMKTRFGTLTAPAAYFVGEARRVNGFLEGACAAYRETLRKQPTHLLADEALRETRKLIATRNRGSQKR